MQDDFFGSAVDAVPPAHPFHLIGGFQCLGHTFLTHHGSLNNVQSIFAGSIDLRQMGKEFFREQQDCKGPDGGLSDRHGASGHISRCGTPLCLTIRDWESDIPILGVGQFHNGLLCGNVWS